MRLIKGGVPTCYAEDLKPGEVFKHDNGRYSTNWMVVYNHPDSLTTIVQAKSTLGKNDGAIVTNRFEYGRKVELELIQQTTIDEIKEFRKTIVGNGTMHRMSFQQFLTLLPDLRIYPNFKVEVEPDVVTVKIPL